jgi:hypothetical protein
VVIVGRPLSRFLDDSRTLEITRLCTLRNARNAASRLLGAAYRAAGALGYERIITYTTAEETATACRAAGFLPVGHVPAQSWSRPSRRRDSDSEPCERIRWERRLTTPHLFRGSNE